MSRAGPATPIFVVGLQKSGTTLLKRLLQETGLVAAPFNGEGDDFFGNEPSFSPEGYPAGAVYQRDGGERGHEIGVADATPEVVEVLRDRLRALDDFDESFFVVKNPYNTVRVRWLRALFPDALIVAMVRRSVPNVFSLLKKHTGTGPSRIEPEHGWWGVKPAGWRAHADDDVLDRLAFQWSAVNARLHEDRDALDAVIAYHDLCCAPSATIERVLGRHIAPAFGPIRCLDDEYTTGADLRSKNRHYLRGRSFTIPTNEHVEIPALDGASVERITERCARTTATLPELR